MMSVLAGMIGQVAAQKALPYVSRVLSERFGKGGEMAGKLVTEIAEYAGVTVEDLPRVAREQPDVFEHAVVKSESSAAELYEHFVKSQGLMNETIAQDYRKKSWLAWGWRPTWMWLLAFLWLYALIFQPFIKALYVPALASVDVGTLMAVTGIFVTFYMGGHTAKQTIGMWRSGR